MAISGPDLKGVTHEILGDLNLVDGASEKDFVFAALVSCVQACRTEEFSHVSAGLVMEEAFRQGIHPAIVTSPARSRRRMIELIAHFDENELIDRDLSSENFITKKGMDYLGKIVVSGDQSEDSNKPVVD